MNLYTITIAATEQLPMLSLFAVIALLMPVFFIIRRQSVDDGQTLFLKCLSTFLIAFLSVINYYVLEGTTSYFAVTLSGLLLCLIGDFLLGYCHVLGKGHKMYNICRGIGMVIFMIAHIVFLTNYAVHIDNFVWYWIFIPICVSILMFVFSPVAGIKWPHPALAFISFLYMMTICFMLFFGIYYSTDMIRIGTGRELFKASMIIIGSTLFFTSDTILCFMYFGGKKGKVISVINLTTYYLSLICLALAF